MPLPNQATLLTHTMQATAKKIPRGEQYSHGQKITVELENIPLDKNPSGGILVYNIPVKLSTQGS